jgi:hypothetical protein
VTAARNAVERLLGQTEAALEAAKEELKGEVTQDKG